MAKSKGGGKPEFTAQRFALSLHLYPPVAMVRENALELARHLSAHHELTDIHMSDETWEFRRPQSKQGQPRGMIRVQVESQEVTIEHRFPVSGLERFEILTDQVTTAIESVINPDILFGTSVELEYVIDIGGDARKLLLG